jgi:single-strand DNA-binding protein
MDINTVTLTGRLGGDIELRYTNSGTAVANVNLAVESGFGEKKKTLWIGLDLWGKAAESAAQFLGKGRKIAVSGRLDHSEYEDKETGKKVSKTRVVAEQWTFADSERKEGAQSRAEGARNGAGDVPRQSQASAPARRQDPPQGELPINGGDDDIPF